MTLPKAPTERALTGRAYRHPVTNILLPSVTSVLGALPKKALQYWASGAVADRAIDLLPVLVQLLMTGDRSQARRWLCDATNPASAATIGTDAHGAMESVWRRSQGTLIDQSTLDLANMPNNRPYIAAAEAFLSEYAVEVWSVEATHYAPGWAGTSDLIVRTGSGEYVLIDVKTGKGVYPDVALQLGAYAAAHEVTRDGGMTLEPMPEITRGYVLHARPDYAELVPVSWSSNVVVETMSALLAVQNWEHEHSKRALGIPTQIGEFQ